MSVMEQATMKIRPLNFRDTFRKVSEVLKECLNESNSNITEELKKAITSAIDAVDRLLDVYGRSVDVLLPCLYFEDYFLRFLNFSFAYSYASWICGFRFSKVRSEGFNIQIHAIHAYTG